MLAIKQEMPIPEYLHLLSHVAGGMRGIMPHTEELVERFLPFARRLALYDDTGTPRGHACLPVPYTSTVPYEEPKRIIPMPPQIPSIRPQPHTRTRSNPRTLQLKPYL